VSNTRYEISGVYTTRLLSLYATTRLVTLATDVRIPSNGCTIMSAMPSIELKCTSPITGEHKNENEVQTI
jgi:hypothetical protein